MLTFDAGSREVCTIRRVRTNTPLQALVTLNDPVFVEAAGGLAGRMIKAEGTVRERVARGFRLALTRLPDEGHGNPGQLFRTASENGTLWAIERLCRRSALENAPGLEADQKLFINVEPASFHDPQLCRRSFDGLLEATGLRPEQLVLEMTGHAVMREIDAVRQAIDMVRGLGLRVAFDGVSPEHPGLEAVREIRPDYVKIDMSLVRNLHRDPDKRERVERIRRLADPAGITIVAEGVETQEELEALAVAGVRCAQGFLFARPAASPDSPNWEELTTPVAVGSGESRN